MSFRLLFYTSLASLLLFVLLALEVTNGSTLRSIDILAEVGISYAWKPWLTNTVTALTFVFNTDYFAISALIFFIYIAFRKRWRLLLLGVLSLGALSGSTLALKRLFMVPRPSTGLIVESGYSFPSMHSALAMFLFVIFAHYIWELYRERSRLRYLLIGVSGLVTLGIGLSRMYLHVHWLTDVIGGFLVGLFWGLVTLLFLYTIRARNPEKTLRIVRIIFIE